MTEGVKKPVRIVPHGQKGLLVFLQILEQVADGQHGGHQAVRHAHAQLIFDRHAQFHGIQAVGAHVRHNLGFKGDGVGIAVRQRRDDDFFELLEVHDDVLLACDAFIVSKT